MKKEAFDPAEALLELATTNLTAEQRVQIGNLCSYVARKEKKPELYKLSAGMAGDQLHDIVVSVRNELIDREL